MKKLFFLFVCIAICLNGQNIDINSLEKQIFLNNRAGNHIASQEKILDILTKNKLSKLEETKLYLLMANTYRSINDFSSALNYLEKAEKTSINISGEDSIKMNIKAEMAFTYFDNTNYESSYKIIKQIKKEKYRFLDVTNHAYILMQEGYILFLKKDYISADKLYKEALEIMKKDSYCNQPAIMVKQMQLFAALKNFNKVDEIYKSVMKIADTCDIIKYKIYATDEIKIIYDKENNPTKVYQYNRSLDSLNVIYNRNNKLSEMYVSKEKHLENKVETEKKNNKIFLIILLVLGFILILFSFIYLKKNRKHNLEKLRYEEELTKIKKELKVYAESQFSLFNSENNILISNKLNTRQKNILELVAKGFSNREIAEELHITEATVKYHLGNIYKILDIKSRKDLL